MVIDIGQAAPAPDDHAGRDLAGAAHDAVSRHEVIWLTEGGRRVAAIVPAAMVAAYLGGDTRRD